MDFENFATKLLTKSETGDSWNDIYFESVQDNESYYTEDSDDNILNDNGRRSSGKRLKTFDNKHCEKIRKTSSTSSTTERRTTRIERRPTRRQDPTVQNRNAIMARENRRKKKQHMELLQNEFNQRRQEIRLLRNVLKQRDRTVQKLTHETLYLRSIIANKTDVMTLIKTIKGNILPLTSSALRSVTEDKECQRRVDVSEANRSPTTTESSLDLEEKENDFDLGFSNSTISDELGFGNWKSLVNDEDNYMLSAMETHIPELPATDAQLLSNFQTEHNYYLNTNIDTINRKDPVSSGICLHLSGGHVSLEFCAACHSSSQNAWLEEM